MVPRDFKAAICSIGASKDTHASAQLHTAQLRGPLTGSCE